MHSKRRKSDLLSAGVVQEHVLDDELQSCVLADTALIGRSAITNGALMRVDDPAIAAGVIDVALDVADLPADVSVVLCLGDWFCAEDWGDSIFGEPE